MITGEWINNKVSYLLTFSEIRGIIVNKEKGVFEPNDKYYSTLIKSTESSLNYITECMAKYIGFSKFPKVQVKETGIGMQLDTNTIGKIDYHGIDDAIIYVSDKIINDPYRTASTIMHEFSHYILMNCRICLNDYMENEKLTELLAVYAGFGKIMLNGSTPSVKYLNSEKTRMIINRNNAYSSKETAAIFYKYILDKNINTKGIWSNLTAEAEYILKIIVNERNSNKFEKRTNYKNAEPVYNKTKAIEDWIIILCNDCSQKLRIPFAEYNIIVTCPVCKNRINISY